MRVYIPSGVFHQEWDDPTRLTQLLVIVELNEHRLEVESETVFENWLSEFAPKHSSFKGLLDEAYRTSTEELPGSLRLVVSCNEEPNWEPPVLKLSLVQSLRLLKEPLAILVENGENDWNFFIGICSPPVRRSLLRKLDDGLLTVLHGGGNTISQELERRLKSPPTRARTFLVFDSDRLHYSELEDSWQPRRPSDCPAVALEEMARRNIPGRYWRLKRRFIESYMPLDQLLIYIEKENAAQQEARRRCLEVFKGLQEPIRWCYNMKEGLEGDKRDKVRLDRLQGWHLNLSAEAQQALECGFGSKLAKHFRLATEQDFQWDVAAKSEADVAVVSLLRLL